MPALNLNLMMKGLVHLNIRGNPFFRLRHCWLELLFGSYQVSWKVVTDLVNDIAKCLFKTLSQIKINFIVWVSGWIVVQLSCEINWIFQDQKSMRHSLDLYSLDYVDQVDWSSGQAANQNLKSFLLSHWSLLQE